MPDLNLQLDVWTQEVMGILDAADAALSRQVGSAAVSWQASDSSTSGSTCLQLTRGSWYVLQPQVQRRDKHCIPPRSDPLCAKRTKASDRPGARWCYLLADGSS